MQRLRSSGDGDSAGRPRRPGGNHDPAAEVPLGAPGRRPDEGTGARDSLKVTKVDLRFATWASGPHAASVVEGDGMIAI